MHTPPPSGVQYLAATPEQLAAADQAIENVLACSQLTDYEKGTCRRQINGFGPDQKVEFSKLFLKASNAGYLGSSIPSLVRVAMRTYAAVASIDGLTADMMPDVHHALLPPPDAEGYYSQSARTRSNHLGRLAFLKAKCLERTGMDPTIAEAEAEKIVWSHLPPLPEPRPKEEAEGPAVLSSARRRAIRDALPTIFGHDAYLLTFVRLVISILEANGGHWTGLPQTRLKDLWPRLPATPTQVGLEEVVAGGEHKNIANWNFKGCAQQLETFLKAHKWLASQENAFLADPYLQDGSAIRGETMNSIWNKIQYALELPFRPGPRAYRRHRITRGVTSGEARDDIRMAVGQATPLATHLYAYFDDEAILGLARLMGYTWTLNSTPCHKCSFSLDASADACPRCKQPATVTSDPNEAKLTKFTRAIQGLGCGEAVHE